MWLKNITLVQMRDSEDVGQRMPGNGPKEKRGFMDVVIEDMGIIGVTVD